MIATFDNTGSVFAVACSATQTIAMYACASMDTVRIWSSLLLSLGGTDDAGFSNH